jgi:hypothetical protein
MSRYPDNWREISEFVRFVRADGRCECTEECGEHGGERCEAIHGQPHPVTESKVVLTTAHLGISGDKHDKMDVRLENLKAMCQKCHLRFDIAEHRYNASMTRRNKIIDAGQMEIEWIDESKGG